jgi:hypothetical protein
MMAAFKDEWHGELTQFLDRLPVRPCLAPPAPSFCTVCGRINNPVAAACRFYPLRFERETGHTFIEPAIRPKKDTFEIDLDFEEEEEPGEELLGDAPMIEYERPGATMRVGALPVLPKHAAEAPEEVEVVEAEVVEVLEEPEEKVEKKTVTSVKTAAPKVKVKKVVEKKSGREDWELNEEEEERLIDNLKALQEPIQSKMPKAPSMPEEEPKPTAAIKGPETEPTKEMPPRPADRIPVIAPIYSQPKLKIIDTEKTKKEPAPEEGRPLPPPPPEYKAPQPTVPAPAEAPKPKEPEPSPATPAVPEVPKGPILPAAKRPAEPAPKPLAEAAAPKTGMPEEPAKPATPAAAPAPGTRRTGGLHDIFRKKPAEPQKEPPKEEKKDQDDKDEKKEKDNKDKNAVDEELGRLLKS